ncbi:SDR family NAD(P)-dependent oxidoreductase [Candidatus Saccharibacteria bacterium]|nr:SDR family NAD(P)-dependent oxidoreductase [Candidatus Saccharibacteria bacterium]
MNKQSRTIVITGASDGIGLEAAKVLKKQGAQVVMIGRTPEKTESAAKALGVPYYIADFSRLDEVRELAAKIRRSYPRIDVLVNNAGGVFGERTVTVDGFEKTMQVNHLAHFLLTDLLMDVLIKSKATIINTSSVAHRFLSDFDITDLNMEKKFTSGKAYGNAKLENILFTKELQRLYADKGISAAAFHPGAVASNFASEASGITKFIYHTPLKKLIGLISVEKGADTLVWLATTQPGKDWTPGEYYVKRKVAKTNQEAADPTLAASLWKQSIAMIKNK